MASRYTRKTMATHCTHIQVIIIIIILRMRSACAEALQTYIYIYTHRESLVRNHEPCAKALCNYSQLSFKNYIVFYLLFNFHIFPSECKIIFLFFLILQGYSHYTYRCASLGLLLEPKELTVALGVWLAKGL